MNYIGHHEVARMYDTNASRPFLFGAIASDLARMSGTRVQNITSIDPEVNRGLRFHRLTNKPAFDDQPEVMRLEEDIRHSLNGIFGDNWRIARQGSRVLKDLLFDALFMRDGVVLGELRETLRIAKDEEIDTTGITRPSDAILPVVVRIHDQGPPDYSDPQQAASRLYIVMSKTRTPFDEQLIPHVADVAAEHLPTVYRIGPVALQETVSALRQLTV